MLERNVIADRLPGAARRAVVTGGPTIRSTGAAASAFVIKLISLLDVVLFRAATRSIPPLGSLQVYEYNG
jgi:hypothetical protein